MDITTKYIVHKLNITSSNQISQRASIVVQILTGQQTPPTSNTATTMTTAAKTPTPPVIQLTAHAKAANKLISIVEIAKRDLKVKGVKVFQYNALTSETVSIPRERPKKTGLAEDDQIAGDPVAETGGGADEDDEEDAFETMGAVKKADLGATKLRSVPVLTVYLATRAVKELRAEYG